MRKLMIAALMMLGTSAAFAGDSDALKAILKAKTYSEAESLVKSSLGSLATNEEKAKAYNKLVDLAMEKVNKENTTMAANQMAKQLGTGKEEAYDTLGFYKALYNAFENAFECDKYDNMPNEKGKVKAKFHTANQTRLIGMRLHFINAGQDYGEKDKNEAYKNFAMYVESGKAPLFKDAPNQTPDQYIGEVARVAAVFAFQNNDLENANKYVDVAMADTATYKEALNLKIYMASQDLKTKEDSLKFASTLQGLYEKDPNNDMVLGQLAALYQSLGKKDESAKLLDTRLAADPNNYTALAIKAQNAMNANDHKVAVEYYKKAIAVKADDALIFTYLAFSLNSLATASQNEAEMKKYFEESAGYLEKARQLDPNRERANWSYPLYQCYYTLYGADDARTKEAEALTK